MLAFFLIGSIFFSNEHPKMLNYANSMCTVDSSSYQYQSDGEYIRYGPVWEVRHGKNSTINAIIIGEKRYYCASAAIEGAHEYQVSKYLT
jgi:hypothetical protein